MRQTVNNVVVKRNVTLHDENENEAVWITRTRLHAINGPRSPSIVCPICIVSLEIVIYIFVVGSVDQRHRRNEL